MFILQQLFFNDWITLLWQNNYDYCGRLFQFLWQMLFVFWRPHFPNAREVFLLSLFNFPDAWHCLVISLQQHSHISNISGDQTLQKLCPEKQSVYITCQTLANVSGCSHFNLSEEVNLEEGLDREWWDVWIQFQHKPSNDISYASKRKPTWEAFW